jgi:hypothetical protein
MGDGRYEETKAEEEWLPRSSAILLRYFVCFVVSAQFSQCLRRPKRGLRSSLAVANDSIEQLEFIRLESP